MSKQVQFHPAERVDRPDMQRASADYTYEELRDWFLWLAGKGVFDGFRVRVEDQMLHAGQITVMNGVALDHGGQFVNDPRNTGIRADQQRAAKPGYVEDLSLAWARRDGRYRSLGLHYQVFALDDPPPVRIEHASGIVQAVALSLVETCDDHDFILLRQIGHASQNRRVLADGSFDAHAFQIVARNCALGKHHHIRVPARGFNN